MTEVDCTAEPSQIGVGSNTAAEDFWEEPLHNSFKGAETNRCTHFQELTKHQDRVPPTLGLRAHIGDDGSVGSASA